MADVIKNSSAVARAVCTAPTIQHFWQGTGTPRLPAIEMK